MTEPCIPQFIIFPSTSYPQKPHVVKYWEEYILKGEQMKTLWNTSYLMHKINAVKNKTRVSYWQQYFNDAFI